MRGGMGTRGLGFAERPVDGSDPLGAVTRSRLSGQLPSGTYEQQWGKPPPKPTRAPTGWEWVRNPQPVDNMNFYVLQRLPNNPGTGGWTWR